MADTGTMNFNLPGLHRIKFSNLKSDIVAFYKIVSRFY
ncbi:hypothetical protein D3OALGA1CA_1483 [Olavius algarvensis associated proteobacterium Delta 3]|nr:hypothetical protein D3OALGB2SA_931 [Olavius algarvensis associated proteobacterium Delta 3]CAB5101710.1 hypothetical protein D3OALGA1CA_1483 [Olavius algarvensis associated proteobacterium Delta 3]